MQGTQPPSTQPRRREDPIKRVRNVAASATMLSLIAVAASMTSAVAVEGPQKVLPAVDSIAQTVSAAVPAELSNEDTTPTKTSAGTFTATNGSDSVTIPAAANGQVVSVADGLAVQVGLGTTATTTAVQATDGSVVYDQSGSVDRTVQATTDGFRIHTVIGSASAPTEYVHPVALPAGTRLVLEDQLPSDPENPGPQDPGLVSGAYILDSANNVIGGFASPWAKDANGTLVSTHFEIRGSDLVQVVDHNVSGVVYPVIADPYLGRDMIKGYRWAYHSGYGWTMMVTPTDWSRFLAGAYLAGVYGFKELQAKSGGSLDTNVDGMRDQYICHQQIVAVRYPNKATWNLDEWRPNVSYLQTVNARCNPGGSVIWD